MQNTNTTGFADILSSRSFSSSYALLASALLAILSVPLIIHPTLSRIVPHERDEPPLVKPGIPLIGPVINMIRYESAFHRKVS